METFDFLSPTSLLNKAWGIYKKGITTFLGISLVPVVVTVLFALILINLAGGIESFKNYLSDGDYSNFFVSPEYIFYSFAIFALATFITVLWSHAALFYAIKEREKDIGVKESYILSKDKLTSFIWLHILMFFIILGGYLPFIIPGIIFSIWFCLAVLILINEDIKGLDALLKSRFYVQGRLLGVFLRLVFASFLITIVSFLVQRSGSILAVIFKGVPYIQNYLGQTVSVIFSLFSMSFFMVYVYSLYENLKDLKTGEVFEPSKNAKNVFIAIAVLGIFMSPYAFEILVTILIQLNYIFPLICGARPLC